jgi:hypothetical protein
MVAGGANYDVEGRSNSWLRQKTAECAAGLAAEFRVRDAAPLVGSLDVNIVPQHFRFGGRVGNRQRKRDYTLHQQQAEG